jgi:hypothetical protein
MAIASNPTTEWVRGTLVRHRAGDPQAACELIQHFLPLADIYVGRHLRGLASHPRLTRDDLRSQVHLDLCEAVARLATNATPPEDVARYIAGHLTYSIEHLLRGESADVLRTPAEKRRMKRAAQRIGEPEKRPPPQIKQTRRRPRLEHFTKADARDAHDIEAMLDPRASGNGGLSDRIDPRVPTIEDPTIYTHHRTSRFDQRSPLDQMIADEELEMQKLEAAEILRRLPEVSRTPLEKSVAGMLACGLPLDEVQASLPGISEKTLLNIIATLSDRVRRLA